MPRDLQDRRFSNQRVNSVAVDQPRRWGSRQPVHLAHGEHLLIATQAPPSAAAAHVQLSTVKTNTWATPASLQQWAAGVEAIPPEATANFGTPDPVSEDVPQRPDSAPPPSPRRIVEYTDSDTEQLPPMPTVNSSPITAVSHLGPEQPEHVSRLSVKPWGYPETQAASSTLPRDYLGSTEATASPNATTQPRGFATRRQPIDRGVWGWWKREPHPQFSPHFASRRLLVTQVVVCSALIPRTSFGIRAEPFRTMLCDHFSRYGPVRCV